uniref:Uncharacterized protein n=1 Tax=Anguilla anguilla TaxID=7936 RepID=A0A0E9PTE5_ANGAN
MQRSLQPWIFRHSDRYSDTQSRIVLYPRLFPTFRLANASG